MTKLFSFCLALLAVTLALPVRAEDAPPVPQKEGGPPRVFKITARKNAGNLPYGHYFYDQKLLDGYLPPRPRMVDFLWRISFIELSEPEQDAYQPKSWGVALVGDGFEQTLTIGRGGYFRLPELGVGRQDATIMFKEQSMPNVLKVAWVVKVGADQRLSYPEFREAVDEVHAAQRAMPFGYTPLKTERSARFDGLKACFLGAGGTLLIDGKPAADATVGHCSILKFDPARAHSDETIEFRGPLQIVTVVETAHYFHAPAPAPAARAGETRETQNTPGMPPTVQVKARTNAGDLAYAWVFEDQRLLQGYLPANDRMVDFVWRISFREMKVSEQDAWTPQGWAVALVGDGFDQTVPVERGGYFVLPALPLGRQGATIMFKEQSMKGKIAAGWIVHVGSSQSLSYADFGKAMEQVHAVQDAIPVQQAGLKPVRDSKYDGVKACFLDAGGAAFIDGQPVADARLGNCTILKFDPARAAGGQVIEFRGALQVVTVVETADYLAPKT
jgi:hypothetical protein